MFAKSTLLLLLIFPLVAFAQIDCKLLNPAAELSDEKEGKIKVGAETLYKIAKGEVVTEGKVRSQVVNLQRGFPVKDQTLVALRTIYLFCGMVASAKDVSTVRKVELFKAMMRVQALPPTPTPPPPPRKAHPKPPPTSSVQASTPAADCKPIRVEPELQASTSTDNRDGEHCKGRTPCSPDGKWWASERELTVSADSGEELRNWRLECAGTGCTHMETMSVSPSEGNRRIAVRAKTWSLPVTLRLHAERWTLCSKVR